MKTMKQNSYCKENIMIMKKSMAWRNQGHTDHKFISQNDQLYSEFD